MMIALINLGTATPEITSGDHKRLPTNVRTAHNFGGVIVSTTSTLNVIASKVAACTTSLPSSK